MNSPLCNFFRISDVRKFLWNGILVYYTLSPYLIEIILTHGVSYESLCKPKIHGETHLKTGLELTEISKDQR